MDISLLDPGKPSTFLVRSAFFITTIAVVLLTPFAANNFVQGRILLGVGSLAVIALCAFNSWNCSKNRYRPLVILFGLDPAVILFLVFAFDQLGTIGALWSYPAVLSFYFMLPERHAWVANVALFAFVGPAAAEAFDHGIAIRFIATLLATSVFAAAFVRYINVQQRELESLAITDPLTGLMNRALLDTELHRAIQQRQRVGAPMTLLLIDLDHFKKINDTYGHESGDEVLRLVGEYLRKRMRATDSVFRIGGEEFLILLYNTDLANGCLTAEEIRRDIASRELLPGCTVTASIGVASLEGDESPPSWVRRGDENLYHAKAGGRNRVVGCHGCAPLVTG